MHRSPAKLLAFVEDVAKGYVNYYKLAKKHGVSEAQFWVWMKRSSQGDENFLIEYQDEPMQFFDAMVAARQQALMYAGGVMEERAIFGHDELYFHSGAPVWEVDTRAVGMDEETREMCGLPKDGLKRDADGNVIQVRIHHLPSQALTEFVMKANLPLYRSRLEIDQTVTHNEGGTGIQHATPRPYNKAAPIPPAPVRPMLVHDADNVADHVDGGPPTAEVKSGPHPDVNKAQSPMRAEFERMLREKGVR
jgi:hypothetical protein